MSDHSDNQLQANLNPSNLNNNNTLTNRKFQPIPPFVSLLVINALYLAYPRLTISAIIFVIEASSITSTKTSEIQETPDDSTSITTHGLIRCFKNPGTTTEKEKLLVIGKTLLITNL